MCLPKTGSHSQATRRSVSLQRPCCDLMPTQHLSVENRSDRATTVSQEQLKGSRVVEPTSEHLVTDAGLI